MQAIRRLLPVAHIVVLLLVAMIAINQVMLSIAHAYPDWLPYHMEGTGFTEDIAQRVAAAEDRYPSDAAHGQYLCALLGLSSLREASDLQLMTRLTDDKVRLLGLCGAGPSLEDIADQSASLRDSTLHPDLVIIGINEFHQAKPTAEVAAANARERVTFTQALMHGDMRDILKPLRDKIWFYQRRQDVSLESESVLLSAKVKIVRAMGARMENPTTDPWREMIHLEAPERATAATFHDQMVSYGNRKLFDSSTYDLPVAAEQLHTLTQLISELESRGATVVIVIMPEYSELRDRVPPIAMQRLLASLQKLGGSAPAVVNFRNALGDDDFSDISHVNVNGRADFSRLLAAKIVEFLPHHPPLMASSSH
ncbi:MAG TPA: hypothetical protein VGG44_06575 [Tepidisphaeraceae bacterium]|jgi:hypothetical protein